MVNPERNFKGIEYRLRLEGDEIVETKEADLVFTSQMGISTQAPVVGGDWMFPDSVLEALGFKSTRKTWDYCFARWFGPNGDIGHTMVGIPFRGMMNEGMGKAETIGMGSRFVTSRLANHLYKNSNLLATIVEMNYQGFVCFLMSGDEVVGIRLGMPEWGIYNALEALKSEWPISKFLSDARHGCFYESWTISLLVTRFPWPHEDKADRVVVEEAPSEHFWFLDPSPSKRGLWTEQTRLGVLTSWGLRINEASERILGLARKLKVPEIQFRTDLARSLSSAWGSIREACYWQNETKSPMKSLHA